MSEYFRRMERLSRKFQLFSNFQAIFAPSNRFFTEKSRWVPLKQSLCIFLLAPSYKIYKHCTSPHVATYVRLPQLSQSALGLTRKVTGRCGTKELKCCATCNVVNHEFITSRYLSVRVRSYSGQTSMALFSCSLGRQYIWRRGSSQRAS